MNFENPLKKNPSEPIKNDLKNKKGVIKALVVAGALAGGFAIAKEMQDTDVHTSQHNDSKKNELVVDTNKISPEKDLSRTVFLSPEEIQLETKRQESFYEEYAKYTKFYGDSLYSNHDLLSPDFKPGNSRLTEETRLLQYFLRNGRQKTFEAAEKLGSKYHQTILSTADSITQIFGDAGINIEGETIEWVEVPEGRSGGMGRDGKMFGGNDEQIMTVEGYTEKLDDWILLPAQKAGYTIDTRDAFAGTVANEMSHEIQFKYFPSLFAGDNWDKLDKHLKNFETVIPNLRFQSNSQIGEFLSDVADWSTGNQHGAYYRFFNPLNYMSEHTTFGGGKEDRYWYSYQVQKYAMEQVLKNKGYKDAKIIVKHLIEKAEDTKNRDELFISARKYFQEEDLKEIAKIFRTIGVKLLNEMKPYFQKEK